MNCAYCDLPEIKQRIVIKNSFAQAFPTNIPIVPGHIIISPIRHVECFEDLTADEFRSIHELVLLLKPVLVRLFGAEGFNFAWNEGKSAGQSVFHFHLHMLPRKKGDSGITNYEPREFLYRPGSRETTPEDELRKIAGLIRAELDKVTGIKDVQKPVETRLIVSAVIEKDNLLLFGRKPKNRCPYPDTWHLLGGGVNAGEKTVDAIKREVKEEAGICVEIIKSLGFDDDFEPNKHGEETHYVFLVYLTKWISGAPIPSDDISELRWFPKNNLPVEELNRPSIKLFRRLGYI